MDADGAVDDISVRMDMWFDGALLVLIVVNSTLAGRKNKGWL